MRATGLAGLFRKEETWKLAIPLFKFHWTHVLESGMATNPMVKTATLPQLDLNPMQATLVSIGQGMFSKSRPIRPKNRYVRSQRRKPVKSAYNDKRLSSFSLLPDAGITL